MKNNTKEQPSYYAILTANVRYSKVLSANEKIMFAEITALSQKTGRCYATNKYFADLYDVSQKSVSRWITNLRKEGFVNVYQIKEAYEKDGQIKYKQIRYVIANTTPPMDTDVHTPLDKNVHPPMDTDVPLITVQGFNTTSKNKNTCSLNSKKSISETSTTQTLEENVFPIENEDSGRALKSKESKSSDNTNKNSNTTEKRTETPRKSTNVSKDKDLYQDLIKSIVERVNDISNKSFKFDSSDSQRLIPKCLDTFKKSELKDGSALEKIYEMLHLKWSHTDKDSDIYFTVAYFRISTLFAKANFEKYLGELEDHKREQAKKAEQRKQSPKPSSNWDII